jgi:hypothetical protein
MHSAEYSNEQTTLVIQGDHGYDLQQRAGCIEVTRCNATAQVIPTRRIGRVIYRNPHNPSLSALLELVERGVTVHFQNGHGDLRATLIPTELAPSPETRHLISTIEGRSNINRYREWRSLQLRHHASLILRQAPAGAIEQFEYLLKRYAARHTAPQVFAQLWLEAQGLLHAHVDGYLTRHRLRRLADTLRWQQHDLTRDLDRVLTIPLLWQLSPWLRQHPQPSPRQLMTFIEQQRDDFDGALHKAMSALHYHLNRIRVKVP